MKDPNKVNDGYQSGNRTKIDQRRLNSKIIYYQKILLQWLKSITLTLEKSANF